MKLSTINCVICEKEVFPKNWSQVTCGNLKCRREVKIRWKSKNLEYQKECLCCGIDFKTTISSKKYCSTLCSTKIRKMRTKLNSTHWARKKNGTYTKYATILRQVGFTVIAPRGGIR